MVMFDEDIQIWLEDKDHQEQIYDIVLNKLFEKYHNEIMEIIEAAKRYNH